MADIFGNEASATGASGTSGASDSSKEEVKKINLKEELKNITSKWEELYFDIINKNGHHSYKNEEHINLLVKNLNLFALQLSNTLSKVEPSFINSGKLDNLISNINNIIGTAKQTNLDDWTSKRNLQTLISENLKDINTEISCLDEDLEFTEGIPILGNVGLTGGISINGQPNIIKSNAEPTAAEFVRNAAVTLMASNFMEGKDQKYVIRQCVIYAKNLYNELYNQGFFPETSGQPLQSGRNKYPLN